MEYFHDYQIVCQSVFGAIASGYCYMG